MIPIVVFELLIFDRQIVSQIVVRKKTAAVGLSMLLLIVVGFILGIVALFGISKQGTKGILAPAIVGIVINGLLILFVFINLIS